jgi:hypothetical protein
LFADIYSSTDCKGLELAAAPVYQPEYGVATGAGTIQAGSRPDNDCGLELFQGGYSDYESILPCFKLVLKPA